MSSGGRRRREGETGGRLAPDRQSERDPRATLTMTDLCTFTRLLGDIAPSIELIDGWLFIDRSAAGREKLLLEIAKYPDLAAAQQWINLVPIDDFVDCAVSDWELDDPLIAEIGAVYERAWRAIVQSEYGIRDAVSVELLKDTDSGDLAVRLSQPEPVKMD